MFAFLFLAALGPARAADEAACDAKALVAEVREAAPIDRPGPFLRLADCDAEAARAVAAEIVPGLVPEEEGIEAALRAIELGAGAAVGAWIEGLQSDERAKTIHALGGACAESEAVQGFLAERAGALGEDFWAQRWYRAVTECPAPPLLALLEQRLDAGVGDDRSGFFGVLEAYARAAGGAALPRLEALATSTDDEEVQSYVVQAFADAARVGSPQGTDAATASKAVAAIVRIAPKLGPKAVEQARLTLVALGDERTADELVAVRFQDRVQGDGTLLWATVVVERATCRNGKRKVRVHAAEVHDPGQTWPDQLHDKVKASVETAWRLDLAARCKGEGTVEVLVPGEPFADRAAARAWMDEQVDGVLEGAGTKVTRLDEPDLAL